MIKKNWKKVVFFGFLCALYTAVIYYLNKNFDLNFNYGYVFAAFIVGYVPVHLTFALLWKLYLRVMGHKVKFKTTAIMELISGFMKMISPFQLNIPFRAFYLKRFNISASEVIGFSMLHLLLEVAVISMCTLILGYLFGSTVSTIFIIPLIIVGLLFLFSNSIEKIISKFRGKLKPGLLSKIVKALEKIPYAGRLCRQHPSIIFYAIGFIMIIYLIRALRISIIALSLGANLPLDYAFYVICFSSVIVTLSRVPGGVGIREVTGMILLRSIMPEGIALSVFVVDQIIGLSLIAVLGGGLFAKIFHGDIKTFIKNRKKT